MNGTKDSNVAALLKRAAIFLKKIISPVLTESGGSGSGKTRFFVKPNLMQMHSSYVVTDPNVLLSQGQRIFQP